MSTGADETRYFNTPEDMLARMKEFGTSRYDNGLCASGMPPDIEAPLFPELREGGLLPGTQVIYSVGMLVHKLGDQLGPAKPVPTMALSFGRASENVASLVTSPDPAYKYDTPKLGS